MKRWFPTTKAVQRAIHVLFLLALGWHVAPAAGWAQSSPGTQRPIAEMEIAPGVRKIYFEEPEHEKKKDSPSTATAGHKQEVKKLPPGAGASEARPARTWEQRTAKRESLHDNRSLAGGTEATRAPASPVVPESPAPGPAEDSFAEACEVTSGTVAAATGVPTFPIALVGGIVLVALVLALVLIGSARRLAHTHRTLLRMHNLENASAQALKQVAEALAQVSLVRVQACDPPLPTATTQAAPPDEALPEPEHFDLGPTFEEERQLREEQARLQEEGVLRQLFEDNQRLQVQLKTAAVQS